MQKGASGLSNPNIYSQSHLRGLATYAAHARANARVCSLGKEPDVTSSRVCLPPSSLTNESSQYVCGAFVKAILTVCCSCKTVIDN
jgi:hypothetical protein